MTNPQAITLRKKKLAVLLLDARLTNKRTVDDCANVLGLPVSRYEAYERGIQSPSLPELEGLAYFFNVPLNHFWGNSTLTENGDPSIQDAKLHQILSLRQRIIGSLLQKFRIEKDISIEDLSQKVNITSDTLESYELGQSPVPIPELELLVGALGRSMQEFHDSHGPIGTWIREQYTVQQITDMPPRLQEFISKPINRPYIELAERLSEMSVEKLRAVAEGLLEITL